MEIVLGIDIGGTSTKLGLVRADGLIVETKTINTAICKDERTFFSLLFHEIEQFLAEFVASYSCIGIGIGAPSCDESAGVLEKAANFPFSERVSILALFQDRFDFPVCLTKDGNATTLGEARYGAGRGIDNFVLITLGTGIGGGIVLNGSLVKGANGWAGEFGHVIVEPGGRACGCGRSGCLETYASATGLQRTALLRLAETTRESSLRERVAEGLQAKDIYLAAKTGDELSLSIFKEVGQHLGLSLIHISKQNTDLNGICLIPNIWFISSAAGFNWMGFFVSSEVMSVDSIASFFVKTTLGKEKITVLDRSSGPTSAVVVLLNEYDYDQLVVFLGFIARRGNNFELRLKVDI